MLCVCDDGASCSSRLAPTVRVWRKSKARWAVASSGFCEVSNSMISSLLIGFYGFSPVRANSHQQNIGTLDRKGIVLMIFPNQDVDGEFFLGLRLFARSHSMSCDAFKVKGLTLPRFIHFNYTDDFDMSGP